MGEYARGKNPKSLANLRGPRWAKGESGNPGGRPHEGPHITPHLNRYAEMGATEFLAIDRSTLTVAEVVAMTLLREAMQSGYDKGREMVVERLDGRLTAKTELTGADGGPVVVVREVGGFNHDDI